MKLDSYFVLDLSNQNISAIADFAFEPLRRVQALKLAKNHLRVVTRDTFANCTVETIDVSGNAIRTVADGAFAGTLTRQQGLPHNTLLKSLDLSDNLIRHLSNATFAGLGRLVSLGLIDNRISTIQVCLCVSVTPRGPPTER